MKLYTVKEEYISYLKNFSNNIKYNKNETRPYVGIILKINGHNYFAPLGSPKLKHINMKEMIDFIKMNNGKLGVINLNNMIPIPLKEVKNIEFSKYDKNYNKLLLEQERWIKRNENIIKKKSNKLYIIITTKENTIFHKRSNNFSLLEEKVIEYEQLTEKKNS